MKLTITMATHDDYDGVYFTIQSLRLHHKLPPDTEFLVLDNNPNSAHGKAVQALAKGVAGLRVVEVTDRTSSFVKYDAFTLAKGDVILGLDCHVLLQPGAIDALMEYWRMNPDSRDMVSGPLLYNDLRATSVKMEPRWRGHDFGCWGDEPESMKTGVPFPIPMMGMGCYSLLKKHAPQINPSFRGFGAEEWYMAEKIRQNGGRVICHPALGWNHRFDWPKRNFPLTIEDKVRNYYIGWMELYGSLDDPRIKEMTEHWAPLMSGGRLEAIISQVAASKLTQQDLLRQIMDAPEKCLTRPQIWHRYLGVAGEGDFVELGVWTGRSINYMSQVRPGNTFHGFDSFQGLPTDWKPQHGAGHFSTDLSKLKFNPNVKIHEGMFSATLPEFVRQPPAKLAGVHIDCDLGSSTTESLTHLGPLILRDKPVLLFDEMYNYREYEGHEFKSFLDWVNETKARFKVLARNEKHQQVLIQML